jgi:hypothetical protein
MNHRTGDVSIRQVRKVDGISDGTEDVTRIPPRSDTGSFPTVTEPVSASTTVDARKLHPLEPRNYNLLTIPVMLPV